MRSCVTATLAAALLAGCDCTVDERAPADVGQACRPSEIPAEGYSADETVVRRPTRVCDDACIVHRHEGDLDPDAVETQESIEADVYCTCACGNLVCGNLDDVLCPMCPEGFECCSLGPEAECGPGMVSDWCVREGTCPE